MKQLPASGSAKANGRFRRFVGVDFSAAADGGRKTWIACGRPDSGALVVDDARPAADLPGSGAAPAAFLPALRRWLAGQAAALVGCDFPFALPLALMADADWAAFATGLARRHPDPEAFRQACRGQAGGRELKRRCDREARTPFSAYNLRLYRQTYRGITGLLAPLSADPRIGVAPVLRAETADVLLAEICPASTLKRLDLYRPYKSRAAAARAHRAVILARLKHAGVAPTRAIADLAVADAGGDLLDAMIAAYAAWHTAATDPSALARPRDEVDRREARVYF